MFRKFLFYILLILINISCKGQEKSSTNTFKKPIDSAEQTYQKQKHHFEFDAYKMIYNGSAIRLESIFSAIRIFGKSDTEYHDYIYYNNPINFRVSITPEKNKDGKELFEYDGKKYPFSDQNGIIKNNWLLYKKNGKDLYIRDKDSILVGDVLTYRLWMSPDEITSYIPTKQDSINAKIPALNGYIKINGKLIHQSITKKELKEKLYPLPAEGQLTNMLGDPVLIYDLGKDYKKFDPNMDPEDTGFL